MLSGCAQTHYTAAVTLGGTQTFNLAVDSGSTTMAVASSSCASCGGSSAYTPGASAHDQNQPAQGTYYDGRSGWSGEVYTDSIALDGVSPFQMAFVAMEDQHNFFNPKAQCPGAAEPLVQHGILGLGRAAAALQGTDSLINSLQNQGRAETASFALDDLGGTMWVGGYDPQTVSDPPAFFPLLQSSSLLNTQALQGLYVLQATELGIGGAALGEATQNLLLPVDTGTPGFILPTAAYAAVTAALTANPGYQANFSASFLSAGACVPANTATTPDEVDAALPPVSLTFTTADGKGAVVTLPATRSYLQLGVSGDGKHPYYCPVLTASDMGVGLFGASMMRSLVVIFDASGKQVGLAARAGSRAHVDPL